MDVRDGKLGHRPGGNGKHRVGHVACSPAPMLAPQPDGSKRMWSSLRQINAQQMHSTLSKPPHAPHKNTGQDCIWADGMFSGDEEQLRKLPGTRDRTRART
eukprot:2690246-Prymnesium_polylepis.2